MYDTMCLHTDVLDTTFTTYTLKVIQRDEIVSSIWGQNDVMTLLSRHVPAE